MVYGFVWVYYVVGWNSLIVVFEGVFIRISLS